MTEGRRHVVWSTLCAVALGLALAGCGGAGGESGSAGTVDKVPVEVANASLEQVSPTFEYSGTVEAGRKAYLGAEIQGRVEKMHVDVGDRVSEGDLLAELGSEQLMAARAQHVTAEKDWDRAKELLDKNAITPQAYDHALGALEVARANHEMIAASAELRAPFAGLITERYLDEGELYTLMPTSAASPAIFELADISEVKIVFEVGERERAAIAKGLKADVTVDTYPGRTFKGTVTRVDPSLDMMSRTATVEVTVPNGRGELRPGVFADVTISLVPREALIIPRDALIRQEGTGMFFVYAVEDSVARRRVVDLGDGLGANIEVLGGLNGGETIVTAGRYRLHDGSAVRIRPPASGETPPTDSGAGASTDSSMSGSGEEASR